MQINVNCIKYYCFILLFLVPQLSRAQIDIGLQLGTSFYDGDVAPAQFGDRFQTLHATFGFMAHYQINRNISVAFGANQLRISGDDALSGRDRNLSFESNITELSLGVEIFPLGFDLDGSGRVLNPFISVGAAYFAFDPEATTFDGTIVKLQPLGLEGQGLSDSIPFYDLSGFSIPFGAGINLSLNSSLYISLRGQVRYTFTDFLDDVSGSYPNFDALIADPARGVRAAELSDRSWELQGDNATFNDGLFGPGIGRGNPAVDDIYVSFTFGVHMVLGASGGGGGRRTPLGCPSF